MEESGCLVARSLTLSVPIYTMQVVEPWHLFPSGYRSTFSCPVIIKNGENMSLKWLRWHLNCRDMTFKYKCPHFYWNRSLQIWLRLLTLLFDDLQHSSFEHPSNSSFPHCWNLFGPWTSPYCKICHPADMTTQAISKTLGPTRNISFMTTILDGGRTGWVFISPRWTTNIRNICWRKCFHSLVVLTWSSSPILGSIVTYSHTVGPWRWLLWYFCWRSLHLRSMYVKFLLYQGWDEEEA